MSKIGRGHNLDRDRRGHSRHSSRPAGLDPRAACEFAGYARNGDPLAWVLTYHQDGGPTGRKPVRFGANPLRALSHERDNSALSAHVGKVGAPLGYRTCRLYRYLYRPVWRSLPHLTPNTTTVRGDSLGSGCKDQSRTNDSNGWQPTGD